MKKEAFFALFLGTLVFVLNAQENSQETKQPKFSFQVKPFLYLMTGVAAGLREDTDDPLIFVDIEFQYALTNKFALFINPSFVNAVTTYYTESTFYSQSDFPTYREAAYYSLGALNFITGILYHPFGNGLRGMYTGVFPILGWGYINKDSKKVENFINIGYMIEAGYEWIFKNGFTITLGGGISKIYPVSLIEIEDKYDFLSEVGWPTYNLYGLNLYKLPFDTRLRFSIGYSF
jgi:hypothetical protein